MLPAIERADGGAVGGADVSEVGRPRRWGAGGGVVVGVAWWSSGWWCGHSAVTSAKAVRVEDSSTKLGVLRTPGKRLAASLVGVCAAQAPGQP